MAVLGLSLCATAFSSCGEWGPLLIAVRGPPTIAASLVAGHRLQTRRLSSCGSRAQPLRGMWDPPRTRAQTRVPRTSRQILNHCATREAPCVQLFAKMDPTTVASGCMSTLIMGWRPPSLSDPQGAFLRMCRQGSFP